MHITHVRRQWPTHVRFSSAAARLPRIHEYVIATPHHHHQQHVQCTYDIVHAVTYVMRALCARMSPSRRAPSANALAHTEMRLAKGVNALLHVSTPHFACHRHVHTSRHPACMASRWRKFFIRCRCCCGERVGLDTYNTHTPCAHSAPLTFYLARMPPHKLYPNIRTHAYNITFTVVDAARAEKLALLGKNGEQRSRKKIFLN